MEKEILNKKQIKECFEKFANSTNIFLFVLNKEEKNDEVNELFLKKYNLVGDAIYMKTVHDFFINNNPYIHVENTRKALSGENTVYEWESENDFFQTNLSPI